MARFDMVIFGATGFTGRRAVQEVARLSKKYGPFTWAVAGRSETKLQDVLAEASKKTDENLSSIKKIIADVGDMASLKEMCGQAKVLVNCCGPYRLYGEPVVRATIDMKTHYVDVSGEPQFMETMQLEYDAQAQENGVYIISACGFDSIPNDMGIVFLQQNFEGTVNSVESYLSTYIPPELRAEAARTGMVHYGTWESLVYSVAHMKELAPLRKKLYPERMPTFKPKLQSRGVLHKRGGKWFLPFPGADASVVYRSQRRRFEAGQRPAQFRPYARVGGLGASLLAVAAALLLYLLALCGLSRRLLLDHPRFFSLGIVSRSGPSEAVMANSHFRFSLFASGWSRGRDLDGNQPDKTLAAVVSGVNPGYGATVTGLLLSAVTILKELDKMPGSGGVLTTAVAFKDTDLIKRLQDNDFKFEIVADK
ncbi:saccharopine dehydrogenase-like oxidoreductase [Hyposmocoma kahamanoa]|uniref:saccharopine dehydrogenase-like oxidoreductase n=1 Tax=Hyposmocoma kahamanoa TaxID=1477025 RepID=UPI000E6D8D27|nr:saccharopine dehydrogenase-like oxidoreductase [Hyposmocoma kahamanoa]